LVDHVALANQGRENLAENGPTATGILVRKIVFLAKMGNGKWLLHNLPYLPENVCGAI
jgi:hypothetical protein